MKKVAFFLLTLCLMSCYEQKRDCTNYKIGKFVFEHEIDGKTEQSIFERNDSLQIETYNGKIDTATVRWINDCEFVLQKLHPKSMNDKKTIHMKILSTTANGYTFEYSFVGESVKKKGTVTKQ